MSNAFKSVATSTINEEVRRVGFALPSGASDVIESVADRLADHVEEQAKALIESVREDHGEQYHDFAVRYLTTAGFISEPEPEPENVSFTPESDDETVPAWAQALSDRVDRLFTVARERGLNV